MLNMTGMLDEDIPKTMRYNLSNYALASFVSHFHTKIILGTDRIPTNYIGLAKLFVK